MDALNLLFAAALSAHSGSSLPSDIARWEPMMEEASGRFGVPELWIARVMEAESRGRTTIDGKPITSSAGAMGLMQIMPQTWLYLRSRYGLGADPYGSHDNILAGTALLRELYDRFGYPDLFAAYNAGAARLEDFLGSGRALPAETTAYVARVSGLNVRLPTVQKTATDDGAPSSKSPLFFMNATRSGVAIPSSLAVSSDTKLFVTLSSAGH